jgi:hypothetical protein
LNADRRIHFGVKIRLSTQRFHSDGIFADVFSSVFPQVNKQLAQPWSFLKCAALKDTQKRLRGSFRDCRLVFEERRGTRGRHTFESSRIIPVPIHLIETIA